MEKYGNYLTQNIISNVTHIFLFNKNLLLNKNEIPIKESYSIDCSVKPINIDETDYKLLNEIVNNTRFPLRKVSSLQKF